MELSARYYDGIIANVAHVICRIEASANGGILVVRDLMTRADLASYPANDVYPLYGRKNELRIGVTPQNAGARLVVSGPGEIARARSMLPALALKHRIETGKQWRLAGIATMALVSLIVVYLYGVPLLAGRIVGLVPPDWETRLGDTVDTQIEAALREQGGWAVCDDNPNSVANRALARFADAAMEGSGSPFEVNITVIRTDIPNAFALPGGQVYYFSALLDQTENPDEFAGVLAHEIGHVVHRHGMEQLIATAGTGALIGFILGDMTGISVAAGLGAALVDSRFSREHERQADQYSAGVATRLAFKPQGLPDLLDRVAKDDDFTKALALLSTHPLTEERRIAMDALAVDQTNLTEPFSEEEWSAIKTMCGPGTGGDFTPPDSSGKNDKN